MSEASRAQPAVQMIPDFDPRESALVLPDHDVPAPLTADRLDPHWLRERLRQPPAWAPEQTSDRIVLRPGPPRPAAVLVGIVAHRAAPTVLLTQRTLHLRDHSGQVAFPGGRFEVSDLTPEHTALREAQEEVGLAPAQVEVIGHLPEYLTGTGFRITPVVGLVDPGFIAQANPDEVAAVFEVPLGFLMDPRHHQRRRFPVEGGNRQFWAMPYRADPVHEYFIWGATAAMLRNLYRLLAA